jgi:hypothetical protein
MRTYVQGSYILIQYADLTTGIPIICEKQLSMILRSWILIKELKGKRPSWSFSLEVTYMRSCAVCIDGMILLVPSNKNAVRIKVGGDVSIK